MTQAASPYLPMFEKAKESFQKLPHAKRVLRLKALGILDKDGKLAEHYRREPEKKSA